MGFIQVDQGVVTHRKTLRLARLLGEDRYTITGRLVALWAASDQRSPRLGSGLPNEASDQRSPRLGSGLPNGWCLDSWISGSLANIEPDILGKPAELVEGLITVGFLDVDADGHLRLHDWFEYGRVGSDGWEAWERMRASVAPAIFERDGHACVYCSSTRRLTVDHKIPQSRGGNNSRSNLATCCLKCNQSKYNHTPEEWQV